ncbi:MAG: SIR2 family protein [Leifsonia sp.]|nr:SIR2 family protein [Leifsonia sp.]
MTFFDPRPSLATALVGQPGVYALLIGSGVSTGAGIPTGWEVVDALARRAAVAAGSTVDEGFDPSGWWESQGSSLPLGYSSLLGVLGSTPAARRALLAPFFVPSDEEREIGLKVPGPSHEAIASLVQKGLVRVIVTTNFDRLLERAIEAQGISPQIITSDAMIQGMEPMQHMQCTIIKLHGDYAGLSQRNTIDELASYPTRTRRLLSRVLDEYGLIVSGWSGEWDPALVGALQQSANRRYPLYWTSRSSLGEVAQSLTTRSGAHVIENVSADDFFPDLLSRVEALESMTNAPASFNLLLSQLKRALPDPVRHIEVRDLFDRQLDQLRNYFRSRPTAPADNSRETWESGYTEVVARSTTLVKLLVAGVHLDRNREHTGLWVDIIQEGMRARVSPEAAYNRSWDDLQHLPALLLLTGGVAAAVAAGHDDVAAALLRRPRWTDPFRPTEPQPAYYVLKETRVLQKDPLNAVQGAWQFPASHFLVETMVPLLDGLANGPQDARSLVYKAEYRFALATSLFKEPHLIGLAASGEFLFESPVPHQRPARGWAADFQKFGSPEPWRIESGKKRAAFAETLEELSQRLEAITPSE